MNAQILAALDADSAALAGAGSAAQEALALHRDALTILAEGWRSQSGCAAIDLLHRQCADAADVVAALHGAAAELGSLRDALAEPDADGADPAAGQDSLARAAARIGERPTVGFDASALPPASAAPPPAAQPPPSWAPAATSIPLPNLGGALPNLGGAAGGALGGSLIALVAQLADMVRRDEPVTTDGPPDTSVPTPNDPAVPRPVEAVSPTPPAQPHPLPVSPLKDAVPQGQSPPEPPPLLAAERPPPVAPAAPVVPEPIAPEPAPLTAQPPRTPCEIAADDLPQVGG